MAAQGPEVIETCRIKLGDLSISEDSGWRPLDPERVAELVAVFKDGDFGATTLAIPSVLADSEKLIKSSREDGRFRLNNGKSSVAALKQLAAELENWQKSLTEASESGAPSGGDMAAGVEETLLGGGEPPLGGGDAPLSGGLTPLEENPPPTDGGLTPPWAQGKLRDVLLNGLRVDVVVYPVDDDALVVAINGLQHDSEQNRFVPTSIVTKISIVLAQKERVPGGDWTKTSQHLLAIYGPNKRRTVTRWVAAAWELHPDVREHLKIKRIRDLPHSFIFDNKFLLGRGEESRFKLSVEFAKCALDLVADKIDGGQSVTASAFMNEYCAAMKAIEGWERLMVKTYGNVATSFSAFHRVTRMLHTEQGRQRAYACMRDKVPLAGLPGNSAAGGIVELRRVVEEMSKMKAGSAAAPADSEGNGGGMTPFPAEDAGNSLAPDGCDEEQDEEEQAGLPVAAAVEPEVNPVQERAQALAREQLNHIVIHESEASLKAELKVRVLKDQKVIFLLDAPTSKLKVVSDSLRMLEGLGVGKFAVFIPVGRRFDLLAAITSQASRLFPKQSLFIVQCDAGVTQSVRVLPTYAVYLPVSGQESTGVPTAVRANACKAAPWECLRLRCTDRMCPKRPEPPQGDQPTTAQEELHNDDVEGMDEFFNFEEEDAEDDGHAEDDGLVVQGGDGDGNRPCLVDLFPFARPVSHYTCVLREVCHAESAGHLVVVSRTGHPSSLIAGRECGLEVFALLSGVKAHGLAHGKALLDTIMEKRCMKAAAAEVGQSTKRGRGGDLQFIKVAAPEEQLIQLRDVQVDSRNWREGFNRLVQDLPVKTVKLLQQEMDEHQLLVQTVEGGLCLASARPLKEGTIVCPLSALWFDTPGALESFLNIPANSILRDRLIQVDDVFHSEGRGPIWGVLMGVGRYVRHYMGVRRAGPNAILTVDCSKGVRDGLVDLRVKTRNGQGIAARSPIVINYGSDYDLTRIGEEEGQEAKRFRGALDSYFQRREKEDEGGVTPSTEDVPGGDGTALCGGVAPQGGGVAPQGGGVAPQGGGVTLPDPASSSNTGTVPEQDGRPNLGATLEDTGKSKCEGHTVASDIKPAGCSLILKSGPPQTLWLAGGAECGNKKLPPRTPLLMVRNAKLTHSKDGIPFSFKNPKKTFVLELLRGKELSAKESLETLSRTKKVTQILKHGTFPAGQPPASLTPHLPVTGWSLPTGKKWKHSGWPRTWGMLRFSGF